MRGKFNGQVVKGVIFDLDGTLIKSPKPSAKPLIMASELLGIDKENLIAVGDYKYDLMASRKAGIRNILVIHEKYFARNIRI